MRKVLLAVAIGWEAGALDAQAAKAVPPAQASSGVITAGTVYERPGPTTTAFEPEDLAGRDRGPILEHGHFTNLVEKGSGGHPLFSLQVLVMGGGVGDQNPSNQYFLKLTGVKGRTWRLLKEIAPEIVAWGSTGGRPHPTERTERRHAQAAARLVQVGDEFFRMVPRSQRIKIYRAAQLLGTARHFASAIEPAMHERPDEFARKLDSQWSVIKPGWQHAWRGKGSAAEQHVERQYRRAVEFFLLGRGRDSIGLSLEARQAAAKRRATRHDELLREVEPFDF